MKVYPRRCSSETTIEEAGGSRDDAPTIRCKLFAGHSVPHSATFTWTDES